MTRATKAVVETKADVVLCQAKSRDLLVSQAG